MPLVSSIHAGMPFVSGRRSSRFRPLRRIGVDDLGATLAKVTDDAPLILMAHEPDVARRTPSRVALQLSGHTHGGQVRMLGWSPI